MSYVLVGAGFCLAGFVVMDVVATGWIGALLALLGDGARRWSPGQRRWFFAAARALPCAAALLFAALVVGPGYAWLEPRGARETVGPMLALVALAAVALLARGPLFAITAWRATRRLETEWLRGAERVEMARLGIPVWRVREGAAGFWLSGLFRPRLIAGAAVLDALTPAEREAAFGHERAHAASRDNLVRLALAACPGALSIVGLGRRLEREWVAAAEEAADRRAVAGSAAAAVELASALVKVARLAPPAPALVASALGDGNVDSRVRWLLDGDRPLRAPLLAEVAAWAGVLAPLAVVAALSLDHSLVGALHDLAEHLVRRF